MPEQDPPRKKDKPKPTGHPVPKPEKEQRAPIEQDPPRKKGDE